MLAYVLLHTLMLSDVNFEYEDMGNGEVKISKNLQPGIDEITISSPVNLEGKNYNVVEIGSRVFSNQIIKSLFFPSSIKFLGSAMCYESNNLLKVTFSADSNLIKIGDQCFDRCKSLSNFAIPNKVEYIGEYALCSALITSISIPKTVSHIGIGAFSFCQNLTNIKVDPENEFFTEYNGSIYSKNMKKFVAACAKSEIWIMDSVEVILTSALSINSINLIRFPYLLKSVGGFSSSGPKTLTLIYCGLHKFDNIDIQLVNVQVAYTTTTITQHKTNFGIAATQYMDFCPLDILIDPYKTSQIIRKQYNIGFMLLFIVF